MRIVAHTEATDALETALGNEGFNVSVIRGPYGPQMASWSRNSLCLVNHTNAWKEARSEDGYSIIVEADFVPVKGFGQLPLPFDENRSPHSLGYLYACGPQVWDLTGGLRGHAGGMVAYVVSPVVTQKMLEFASAEILSNRPHLYHAWDSQIGYWLKERGVQSFMPYRNYGEHGGKPNPEHRWAGLKATHRADVLWGQLCFLPSYASGSRLRYRMMRLGARTWGLARLFSGRVLAWHDLKRSPEKGLLLRAVVGRQVTRREPQLSADARR